MDFLDSCRCARTRRRAKVEIALAKAKKEHDKRQTMRERQDKREAERAMRTRNRMSRRSGVPAADSGSQTRLTRWRHRVRQSQIHRRADAGHARPTPRRGIADVEQDPACSPCQCRVSGSGHDESFDDHGVEVADRARPGCGCRCRSRCRARCPCTTTGA